VQRKFDTWSRHSNWALENIAFKHPWVYYSDADEHVTPDLRDEVLRVINDPSAKHVAYRLRYKNIFMGRWLRRGGIYPVWIMRLFRPDRVRYEDREVNAHPVVRGSVGQLKEHFIHYSFNKGLVPWFHKHNSYSQMECHEAMRVLGGSFREQLRNAFSPENALRRRAIKNLSFYLPCRALARFVYMFGWKQGCLDGTPGFHYANMIAMYEYWIAIKITEQRSAWRRRVDCLAERMLEEKEQTPAKNGAGIGVDVMIPTFNEADHIRQTVENATKLGNVFVLDSHSTDGTQQIARAAGATVVEHPFVNYSAQKNWGLENLPFTADWIFILDADERITPALRKEILQTVASNPPVDGYFVNRLLLILGRAVRHGGLYPSWNLRLFRRGKARYEERAVHEHMICQGPTSYLRHEMLHIRRETITQFLTKHIRYADTESEEWVRNRFGHVEPAPVSRLFRDILRYRQWLRRRVWPRLPGRPLWRFVYMYVVRGGFLDGKAGWRMARLMSCYEYMISLVYRDKLLRETGGTHNASFAAGPVRPRSGIVPAVAAAKATM
jgi:glycosyltransferase involved in cell wall biosynthesis